MPRVRAGRGGRGRPPRPVRIPRRGDRGNPARGRRLGHSAAGDRPPRTSRSGGTPCARGGAPAKDAAEDGDSHLARPAPGGGRRNLPERPPDGGRWRQPARRARGVAARVAGMAGHRAHGRAHRSRLGADARAYDRAFREGPLARVGGRREDRARRGVGADAAGPRVFDALERLARSSRDDRREEEGHPAALLLLALCLALGVAIGAFLSPFPISGRGRTGGETARLLASLRFPRVALAAIVGGCLAPAGAALQALLKNPLADPSARHFGERRPSGPGRARRPVTASVASGGLRGRRPGLLRSGRAGARRGRLDLQRLLLAG